MSEAPSLHIEETPAEDLDEISAEDLTTLVPPPPSEPPLPLGVDLTLVRFSSELLETIPREIAEQYKVLPVYLRKPKKKKRSSTPGILYTVAADPDDQAMLEDCTLCCNLKVRAFLGNLQEITEAIPIVYEGGQLARPKETSTNTSAASSSAFPLNQATEPTSVVSTSQAAEPTPVVSSPTPVVPALTPKTVPAPPEVRPASSSMPELPLIRPTSTPVPKLSAEEAPISSSLNGSSQKALPSLSIPLLVVLGGDTELAHYGQEAVAALGGQVDVWEFGQMQSKDDGLEPTLLLVSEEVYLFDRRAFNLLAFRLGVPLVVWSQEMDPSDLQAVLLGARRCVRGSVSSFPPPPNKHSME